MESDSIDEIVHAFRMRPNWHEVHHASGLLGEVTDVLDCSPDEGFKGLAEELECLLVGRFLSLEHVLQYTL